MTKQKAVTHVGCLPFRETADGLEIMLITSRGQGIWLVPKGKIKASKNNFKNIKDEARDEAGVEGDLDRNTVYHYSYERKSGRYYVAAYPLEVTKEHGKWKEMDERERCWFDAQTAAAQVGDPELSEVIKKFISTYKN